MRLMAALAIAMAACAASPRAQTMRMGGVFPAHPSNCALELRNGGIDGAMMMAYDVVGVVHVNNADAGEPPNSPRLLALLKTEACGLGGDIVSVGLSANVTYPGSMHGDDSMHTYMVLRKKSPDGAPIVQKF